VRRETRFNLVFLLVFLGVSLPGAVILFRKKLDPSASRMDQPDAVVRQLPYMTPLPAPPDMRWMVPPRTFQWLDNLTQQKTGSAMVSVLGPGPEWEPVISSDHLVQLMAVVPGAASERYSFVVWTEQALPTGGILVHRGGSAADSDGRVTNSEPMALPQDLRRELVALGFAHPPKTIAWADVSFTRTLVPATQKITFDCNASTPPIHSTLEFSPAVQMTGPAPLSTTR
jgi:hypothetical protein